MSIEQRIQGLIEAAINEISLHYDSAVNTEHRSGDHWILMAVLDKHGFRTNNPMQAVELAKEIMTLWYRLQR